MPQQILFRELRLRFDVENAETHCHALVEIGDPLPGVQTWHAMTFPATVRVDEIIAQSAQAPDWPEGSPE